MTSLKASNNRVAWTYTDDQGNDYAISAKALYVTDGTDGAKYGGSAASASVKAIPGNFRPRRVQCVDASGNQRWVVAYELSATIWTTPGTTLVLNYLGSDVSFTTTDHTRGEKKPRRGTYESS